MTFINDFLSMMTNDVVHRMAPITQRTYSHSHNHVHVYQIIPVDKYFFNIHHAEMIYVYVLFTTRALTFYLSMNTI